MSNISELINSGTQALLVVSSADLNAFALEVFRLGRESMKPQRTEPYTREEVARLFQVSAKTVDNWRKCGVFGRQNCKVGRRVAIPCDAINKLLENH